MVDEPDERARIDGSLRGIYEAMSVTTNPIPVKAAMKLLGRGNGEMRLPMCPLDAAGEAKVRQTLVNYGLLKS